MGVDNSAQIAGGNAFGTHVWVLDENQARFPAFVLAPQTSRGWEPDSLELALDLTKAVVRELAVDPTRIYLTGQSTGAIGAWDMVAAHADFFAAAVIVSGRGDPSQAHAVRGVPTWIFHGRLDRTLGVVNARLMAQALKREGGRLNYTEYPEVGHNAWEWAYMEPELIRWMFSQRISG